MFTHACVARAWAAFPHRSASEMPSKVKAKGALSYDAAMVFWRVITQIFFREVRPRGAFHIPREGPVIFVAAPHNNQACVEELRVPSAPSNVNARWLIHFY